MLSVDLSLGEVQISPTLSAAEHCTILLQNSLIRSWSPHHYVRIVYIQSSTSLLRSPRYHTSTLLDSINSVNRWTFQMNQDPLSHSRAKKA